MNKMFMKVRECTLKGFWHIKRRERNHVRRKMMEMESPRIRKRGDQDDKEQCKRRST